MIKKLPLFAALGGLAVPAAIPATAPAVSNCQQHTVSYIAHGKYVDSTPVLAPGTWSGSLTIKLTSANHHLQEGHKRDNQALERRRSGADIRYPKPGQG